MYRQILHKCRACTGHCDMMCSLRANKSPRKQIIILCMVGTIYDHILFVVSRNTRYNGMSYNLIVDIIAGRCRNIVC